MQCNFLNNKSLGIWICEYCGYASRGNVERTCTVSEAQRLQMQRLNRKKKKGGCGCGKKKVQK